MENILNYYYGINVVEITKYDNYYLVKTDNSLEYILSEIYNIDELKNIIDYLNNSNVLYHLLILTINSEIFFVYDDITYSLFKVRDNTNIKMNVLDFYNLYAKGVCSWSDLWSKRVDYYIEQIKEIVDSKEIKYSMDYYISLAEIAISYFNNMKEIYSDNLLTYSISHRDIDNNVYSFFNPANMCVDLSIRDVAEYIKLSFFEEYLTNNDILKILDNLKFNDAMANYFLIRLIYPSYFFKIFDKYIETGKIDTKMYNYIKKTREYEYLLSLIYNKLKVRNEIKAYIYFFKSQY